MMMMRRDDEWCLLSDGADNFERNMTEEFTVITTNVGPRPTALQLKLVEEEPNFDAEAEIAINDIEIDNGAGSSGGGGSGDSNALSVAPVSRVSRDSETMPPPTPRRLHSPRTLGLTESSRARRERFADDAESDCGSRTALRDDWVKNRLASVVRGVVNASRRSHSFMNNNNDDDEYDDGGGGGGGPGWLIPNATRPTTLSPISPERISVLSRHVLTEFPGIWHRRRCDDSFVWISRR